MPAPPPEDIAELATLTVDELKRSVDDLTDEIARAKAQLKAGTLMGLEVFRAGGTDRAVAGDLGPDPRSLRRRRRCWMRSRVPISRAIPNADRPASGDGAVWPR